MGPAKSMTQLTICFMVLNATFNNISVTSWRQFYWWDQCNCNYSPEQIILDCVDIAECWLTFYYVKARFVLFMKVADDTILKLSFYYPKIVYNFLNVLYMISCYHLILYLFVYTCITLCSYLIYF